MNVLYQVLSVTRSSLQSLGYRWRLAVSTVGGIALVVLVLLGFLSMSEGFQKTLDNTGSSDIVIIKSRNTNSESMSWIDIDDAAALDTIKGIRTSGRRPMISRELYRAVMLSGGEERTTLGLRGIEGEGVALRPGMVIAEGRMFEDGNRELIVGRMAADSDDSLRVGHTTQIAGVEWTIVGIFEVARGLYGAEMWTDASSMRDVFKSPSGFNIVRLALAEGSSTDGVRQQLQNDPRTDSLDVLSEKEFYRDQASGLVKAIEMIGWPIAILMAIGAIAGTVNTVYNSVAVQSRDISTLRALGFGRLPVFIAVMAEAIALVLVGGALGVILSILLFNGFEGSTLTGSQSQMSFEFSVTSESVIEAMILAVTVGFIGGMFPALLAAGKPILEGLRE